MGIGGDEDALNVGPNRYFGNFGKASGPNYEEVPAGEVITWGSDSPSYTGFGPCAETSVIVYNLATRVVGFILLPFYMLVHLWFVWRRVKDELGAEGDVDYKEHLDKVQSEAEEDLVVDVKTGEDRKRRELHKSTNGYKAAVISGLIGSFEGMCWWWKVRSYEERNTRAGLEEQKTNAVLTP